MKTRSRKASLARKTIVQIITGSIAAYKSGDLVQSLRNEGARVICVLTESAKHFVTPLTLRAISGERVYDEFFAADLPYGVVHTSLAEEADLILVAPASADFIARLSAGFADDLASCVVLATKKPILMVPAMNDTMYENPLTQRNIKQLKAVGHVFVDPVVGKLVCGREAIGHVSDSATIVHTIQKLL